jgi:hypothetical protein
MLEINVVNEDHKIEEAQYFLNRLSDPHLEIREFSFELSAFLTAARSALQYALEEARLKPGGQAWYESQVKAAEAVKFFKEKRDVSVHAEPVIPKKVINIKMEEHLGIGDFYSIEIINPDGTVVPDAPQETTTQQYTSGITRASSSASVTYHFSDWPDQESVAELCAEYLQQVSEIIHNGRVLDFISQASI